MVPEVVQRANLRKRAQESLGELEEPVDLVPARSVATLVLALEPQEAELWLLSEFGDVPVHLSEASACIYDCLRECLDVTRGLVVLREDNEKR